MSTTFPWVTSYLTPFLLKTAVVSPQLNPMKYTWSWLGSPPFHGSSFWQEEKLRAARAAAMMMIVFFMISPP